MENDQSLKYILERLEKEIVSLQEKVVSLQEKVVERGLLMGRDWLQKLKFIFYGWEEVPPAQKVYLKAMGFLPKYTGHPRKKSFHKKLGNRKLGSYGYVTLTYDPDTHFEYYGRNPWTITVQWKYPGFTEWVTDVW